MHNVKLCFLAGRGDQVTISEIKPNSLGQVVIYYQEQLRLFLKYNNK
jgi:hypothetical protein